MKSENCKNLQFLENKIRTARQKAAPAIKQKLPEKTRREAPYATTLRSKPGSQPQTAADARTLPENLSRKPEFFFRWEQPVELFGLL